MNAELKTYSPQGLAIQAPAETATAALASQAKAMVEARYLVAINRPRDVDTVRQSLLKECRRPGFADAAIYNKPIGKGVEGPSIRFAEAAIRCMTNILPETMTVFDDTEKRIVRVSVTDLEANVTYSQDVTITKTVERRSLKKGETPLKTRVNSFGDQLFILEATDDDILNKQNALISKALRTLGLRLIPGDIVDECMVMCRRVRQDEAAKDPDAAKRALFDAFSAQGVSPTQVKEWLGHTGDVLNPKEYSDLKGLYAALRDGETTWREIMDARKPETDEDKPATTSTTNKRGSADLKGALKKDEPQADTPAPATIDADALERRATEDGGSGDASDAMPL